MAISDVVVCSFYTSDPYYRDHSNLLRKNLERIGVAHELEQIDKPEGQDWADICRQKIGFLARVCRKYPDKRVFWIDVDCNLLELPSYVADFTADLIGFQRGFSSPLRIGYVSRTRFWEPCFFGINTTPAARKFVEEAHTLERSSEFKATDDYFFEESWRANAHALSFQVIPSRAVVAKAGTDAPGVPVFFSFGASGSVEEFKATVAQHQHVGGGSGVPLQARLRRRGLRVAKWIEGLLPSRIGRSLRRIADGVGLTHVLTAGPFDGGFDSLPGETGRGKTGTHRTAIVKEMIMSGQRGETERIDQAFARLASVGVLNDAEIAAKRSADSFASYAGRNPDEMPIRLAWWARPFPGNFGDWLSPLIIASRSNRSIIFQSPTAPTRARHLVSVGSIARFIKAGSIVVGTGVSSTDIDIDPAAHYISVRGPITAEVLDRCGGPRVDSFGDPGALLSRLMPMARGLTNGKLVLVRHFTHANLPVTLPDGIDELSVLMSSADDVRAFVSELHEYDAVVTSAMHVMIACHSYGIPCALVTFEGFESSVHGSGIKYRDYSLGAGLDDVHEPIPIPLDLRRVNVEAMVAKEEISAEKLDEIEAAVDAGVAAYLQHIR